MTEYFIDFDDRKDRDCLYMALKRLRGIHRIDIRKYRARRTDPQNRRYWGFVIRAFSAFLAEQGEHFTDLEVHELLKNKFLRKTWVDTKTGEALDYARSTTELDVKEFTDYVEDVENWMADFGIIVEEPR